VALQRVVGEMSHHRVEVAEQQHAQDSGPLEASDEVLGVTGRGALDALDVRLGRQKGHAERDRLLRARDVAGRRGDPHERLELAFGLKREPGSGVDHRGRAKW
jgi:hypothetical protein